MAKFYGSNLQWFGSAKPRHLIEIEQFGKDDLNELFFRANVMKKVMGEENGTRRYNGWHPHRLMYSFSSGVSTPTCLGFEMAAHRFGMDVVKSQTADIFGPTDQGESLKDNIRLLNQSEPDVIVLGHCEQGALEEAAGYSDAPIISAGDRSSQGPTQALLDVYTILSELGEVDGKTVVLGGDLHFGRTIRPLTYLLAKFEAVKLIFVSHDMLRVNRDFLEYLDRHDVEYYETAELEAAVVQADVVYWTRTQRQRLKGYKVDSDVLQSDYVIDKSIMDILPEQAIVMHPLPRHGEIAEEVDLDPRAAYFRQAGNGLPVSMALLSHILS